jgi:CheY-like chemotaxis protein
MSAILIAEDDPDNAELVCDMLGQAGHDTLVVADGASALDSARSWHPDLMLLDVSLAGPITGLQVCQAMREDPGLAGIPVVMLSGWAFDADLGAGRAAGANACLAKPFRPAELRALVQILLDGQAGHVTA